MQNFSQIAGPKIAASNQKTKIYEDKLQSAKINFEYGCK